MVFRHGLRAILLAALLAALSACGDDRDPKQLVDSAFKKPIDSATLKGDVELKVEGIRGLEQPLRGRVTGPFRSNGDRRLPSFDIQLSLTGAGTNFSRELLSTGRRTFVDVGGVWYEVDRREVARQNRAYARAQRRSRGQGLRSLGIDPLRWIEDAENESDEEVAGVETRHVSGRLDVSALIEDLNRAAARTGGSLGGQPVPRLTEEQRRQVTDVVKDPRFDVYVGKEDGRVRRISGDLELEVPEDQRQNLRGLSGGTVSFSLEFADIGRAPRIRAPTNARPLSALGPIAGALGRGRSGPPRRLDDPIETRRRLERYNRCLERTRRRDAIRRCQPLLR